MVQRTGCVKSFFLRQKQVPWTFSMTSSIPWWVAAPQARPVGGGADECFQLLSFVLCFCLSDFRSSTRTHEFKQVWNESVKCMRVEIKMIVRPTFIECGTHTWSRHCSYRPSQKLKSGTSIIPHSTEVWYKITWTHR